MWLFLWKDCLFQNLQYSSKEVGGMNATNIKLHWWWCCPTVRIGMCSLTRSVARGLEMSIRFLKKFPPPPQKIQKNYPNPKPPITNKQQQKNPKQFKSSTIHKEELIWELCYYLSWDILLTQKDGQELKLLNSLLLSPRTIFPELQQATITEKE